MWLIRDRFLNYDSKTFPSVSRVCQTENTVWKLKSFFSFNMRVKEVLSHMNYKVRTSRNEDPFRKKILWSSGEWAALSNIPFLNILMFNLGTHIPTCDNVLHLYCQEECLTVDKASVWNVNVKIWQITLKPHNRNHGRALSYENKSEGLLSRKKMSILI